LRRYIADGDFLAISLRPVFSASRTQHVSQHVSDVYSKFALSHTMCGSC